MSEIKKLIERLCPEGVEYKKLGDIADITIGEFVHKNKQNPNGKYPVYNGGSSFTGYYDNYNRTGNKIVVSARGAYAGFVNKVYGCYWAGNSSYSIDIISPEVSWHFVYYYLKLKQTFMISKQQKGGGVPAISKKQMQNFEIPVPPIEVQSKIVEILDNYTELESELEAQLEAELEARRKQYEYYRNQLLTFDEAEGARFDVKWMKLGEVCQIMNGKDYKNYPSGNIPVYGTGGIMTYINTYAYDKPSVLLPRKGSIDKTYYVDEPFWTVDTIYWTKINDEVVIPKFMHYYLKTVNLSAMNTGTGAIPSLTQAVLKKISLPIPPLSEQERIVSILDRFEALTTDLQSGLPAEIEARRKQYEYYREQLLTFKRKTA